MAFYCSLTVGQHLQSNCSGLVPAGFWPHTVPVSLFSFFFAVIQHQLIHKSSSDLDGTVCIFPLEGGLISPLLPPSLQEQYSAFLQKNFH